MHHVQKLDIPFIAMYRKEDCLSLLKDPEQPEEEKSTLKWHKVLWAIQELHKKWLLFQNQKRALQFHYNKRFEEESRRGLLHDETPQLFESIMKSLRDAESEREVEDVNSKFNLHFPAGEGQDAIDISSDPGVRKYVRSNYFDFVEVSVTSTKPGLYMDCQKKQLNRFEDAQWFLVQKAEEENLVQVTIKLPEDRLNRLIRDLSNYNLSKLSAQLWNEQRKLILQDALSNFLLPSMEKEARSLLVSRAKNWLLMQCGKALWNRVSMAPPYKRNQTAPPRVMACCWGPGDPATTLVMLDSCGELLDVLCIGTISWENLTWTVPFFDKPTRLRMENDDKRILQFVNDHEPDLAIIGATNMSCDMLKLQLLGIESLQVPEKMIPLRVVYGDETLACLYESSQISADQLPGQSGMVRRAVALGRYLQNPLAMVATLCGPGREILSWKPLTSPFSPQMRSTR
ncbi:putative ribonuclease H-like domain, transcription elongation factor Spt6, Tex-like protein [Rosa chinensis]|uniref:Putative ribonuclease H-like domain, transcription elongation factor Spt6, Tex-like protein n=1 Tax=Rosa chinensis TaxID=74649 RepID=A0A2P6RIR3_ROSCH|nr:putative ribonuclease H-like domain, transcription elongation factor Spt6, Tex-like protein [Rosa chinensis]